MISGIMAQSLGIQGRGEVAAAVLIPIMMSYLGQLGLPSALGVLIHDESVDTRIAIASARVLSLGLAGIAILISLVLVPLFIDSREARTAAAIFTLFIPLNNLASIEIAVLQAELRSVAMSVTRISGVVIYLLAVIVISTLGYGSVTTMVIAQMMGAFLTLLLAHHLTGVKYEAVFERDSARRLSSHGLRAHLGTGQPVDALRIDQFALTLFHSTHALGLYVIATTFAMANRLIGQSIGLVAFPIAARKDSDKGRPLRLLVVGAVILAILAIATEIIFGRWLLKLIFGTYGEEAYSIMVVLVVGSFFTVLKQVLADISRGLGAVNPASISEVVFIVTFFGLAAGLYKHGVIGVSWAATVSAICALISLMLLGYKDLSSAMTSNNLSA